MTADGRLPVLAVVGPTASGKSDLAVALALEVGGEVVGADASQLYRGMDIGTAKLPVEQRRGVRHHEIDVLALTEEASVAAYQRHSRADLGEIRARGRVPVVAGGSGLYVRAALDVLDIPPTDPAVRRRLQAQATEAGAQAMHARLADVDPRAAQAIPPGNVRRVIRALEIVELTGQPVTARMPRRAYVEPTVAVGLLPSRAVTDARVDARVERMWAEGLVEEVRGLQTHGLREGRTASRALGYAQVLRQLDGELTQAQAIAETQRATRRYARRQESWFRPDPRIRWVDPDREDALAAALSILRDVLRENAAHG